MDSADQILKSLKAGRVLDIATGNGNFIQTLLDNLKSYTEVVGIDTSEKGAAAFEQAFTGKAVRFIKMDAARMEFPDASFDTVCISNSLHHMADLEAVLAEMKRVLRPGGHFIVSEMYRDNQTEAQMTHVLLHHWWAAVDTARGVVHNETYTRHQIQEIVNGLGLQDIVFEDARDLNEDPRTPETIKYLTDVVDQYLKRSEGLPQEAALHQRGLEFRQRVEEVGFHSATNLMVIGKRP